MFVCHHFLHLPAGLMVDLQKWRQGSGVDGVRHDIFRRGNELILGLRSGSYLGCLLTDFE